ncbi:hypothetical protein OSH11_23190 [Kaistia dalseonensis]|uniref:Membrane protein n=1 Tax=Kaistia dalseonensis TaxID=410840 RepID=A0ABU0HFJ4_9HYPH|nr:DUF1254 domain-containing protein [Kaistia dalseonensis]MCX5497622.1 hypothetical protein [Kaistia dalseonensis]MDQ0440264.1 putative membrane protein [Kaistia dalseonensis]
MIRGLLFALGGLILGGIIHIVVILLVPDFADRDAWTSMGRFGPDGAFHVLPMSEPGTEPLPYLDPRMATAVCRFSLENGPIRIKADMPDDFWSIAVFNRRGSNVYSLNDRTAERSDIDLVIATPVQLVQLRENPIPALEQSIVIEVPISRGFALIRAFVADPTLLPGAEAALRAANCSADVKAPAPPPAPAPTVEPDTDAP